MELVAFVGFATLLAFASLRLVFAKTALGGALALIVAQLGLAGLYVNLAAPFLATLQILLYAGAVMVLFVFVIMLLDSADSAVQASAPLSIVRSLSAGVALLLAFFVAKVSLHMPLTQSHVDGSMRHVATLLFSRFAFQFEMISVILLIAVVGAVVLSLKRLT